MERKFVKNIFPHNTNFQRSNKFIRHIYMKKQRLSLTPAMFQIHKTI